MLELKNVSVIFNEGTVNEKVALSDINLKLNTGDLLRLLEVMERGNRHYFKLFQEQ